MDPLDKAILASLYVSSLEPQVSSFDRINYRLPIGKEFYRLKVQQLSELGFLEKNNDYKLSFFGRDALKVVLVGGVCL
jgi:FAD synthetase